MASNRNTADFIKFAVLRLQNRLTSKCIPKRKFRSVMFLCLLCSFENVPTPILFQCLLKPAIDCDDLEVILVEVNHLLNDCN